MDNLSGPGAAAQRGLRTALGVSERLTGSRRHATCPSIHPSNPASGLPTYFRDRAPARGSARTGAVRRSGSLERIGQLTARHEIRVLYYSVQTNVRALDLSHDNSEWMFTDSGDHLSEEGMEAVAGRFASSVLALRDASGI